MSETIKCVKCEAEYEVTRRYSKHRIITKELCRLCGNDLALEDGYCAVSYTLTAHPPIPESSAS